MKKYIKNLIQLVNYEREAEIDLMTQGIWVWAQGMLENMIISFIIISILAIMYYISLEKKVKELNND